MSFFNTLANTQAVAPKLIWSSEVKTKLHSPGEQRQEVGAKNSSQA